MAALSLEDVIKLIQMDGKLLTRSMQIISSRDLMLSRARGGKQLGHHGNE
jgi:hypothetical protein